MADTSNLSQFLTDVADAIRTKKETTEQIPAENFDQEILSIETGIDTSDATATQKDIALGKTAYTKDGKITGSGYVAEEIMGKTDYKPIQFTVQSYSKYPKLYVFDKLAIRYSFSGTAMYFYYNGEQIGTYTAKYSSDKYLGVVYHDDTQYIFIVNNVSIYTTNYEAISVNFINKTVTDLGQISTIDTTSSFYTDGENIQLGTSNYLYRYQKSTNTFKKYNQLKGTNPYFTGNNFAIYCAESRGYINSFVYDSISDTYSIVSKQINNVNGINYYGNKIFRNGNVYVLNPNLTIGELIATNVYTAKVSSGATFKWISDTYVIYDEYLWYWDDENNTLTKQAAMSYACTSGYIKLSDNDYTLCVFESSDKVIGVKVNGQNLYFSNTYTTATSDEVLNNRIVYDSGTTPIVGTMPDNGELSYTPTTTEQTIPKGYTSGGTVSAVDASIDSNILPENIKKDITILGITGTLEEDSGGSSEPVEGAKIFESIEEMNNSTGNVEGDLAIVYRNEIQNATVDSHFQTATFPDTVVLDNAITDYVEVRYRAVDSSKMFDCWGSLDSSRFMMNCYSDSGEVRIEYTSSDGITYTRTDTTGNPVDFGTEIYYERPEMWNDAIGYFIQVGGGTFEGLYEYAHGKDYDDFNAITNIEISYTTDKLSAESFSYNIKYIRTSILNQLAKLIKPLKTEVRDILVEQIDDDTYNLHISHADRYTISTSFITKYYDDGDTNLYPGIISSSSEVWSPYVYKVILSQNSIEDITSSFTIETITTTMDSTTAICKYITTPINTSHAWTTINCNSDDITDKAITLGSKVTYSDGGSIYVVSGTIPTTISEKTQYFIAPTQLTLSNPNELLPGKVTYGNNGVVVGDGSIYENLDYDSIWSKYYIKSSGKNGVLKVYNTDIQLPPVITYNESEENTSSYIYINSATTNFPYVIDEEGASKSTTDYYVKLSDNEVMRFENLSSSTKLQKYTLNDGIITISLYDTLSGFTFSTGNYPLVAKYDASDNCIYIINPSNNNFKFYKYDMEAKELTQLFGNSSLDLNINYCWYDICLENQTIFVYGVYTEFLAITFNGVATKIEDVTLTSFYSYNPSNSYSSTYMLTYNGTESSAKIYNMKTKSYTDIVIDNLKNCQLYDNNDGTATYVLCDDTLYKIQNDEVVKTTTIDKTSLNLIPRDDNGNTFSSTSQCISATNIPIAFNNKIYGRFMYIDTTTDIAYINTQIMKNPFVLYHNKGHICSVGSTVYQFTYVNLVEDGVGQYVAFINSGNTSYSVTQYDTNNIKNKFTLNSSIMSQDEYTEALNTVDQILGEEV